MGVIDAFRLKQLMLIHVSVGMCCIVTFTNTHKEEKLKCPGDPYLFTDKAVFPDPMVVEHLIIQITASQQV